MRNSKNKWLIIFCLVYSGEMIFSLPFHVARFFRPTVLDVFALNNTQLGDVFAVYGIFAMLAYFPGGVIADHFSARKLMTVSLITTAIGGLYFAQIPSGAGLALLFGYWGVTSILLFWASMIKATREWGGRSKQGSAFGILEAGRGFVAAAAASVSVGILSLFLPADLESLTDPQRIQAVQSVIYFYTLMTLLAALLIWRFIPDTINTSAQNPLMSGITTVIKMPVVWLQAMIIICAYCGYKGLDNYALYARDVLQMDEIESAQFTAAAAYLRPIAALAAGYIVDRYIASRVIVIAFFLLLVSYLLISFSVPTATEFKPGLNLIYLNIMITFVGVYGIRGVYFSLLEETKVAEKHTGTAVGLISVIGFTPDVFFASIAGRILDASPGIEGHQNYFLMLAGFAIVGMLATWFLAIYTAKLKRNEHSFLGCG